MEIKIADKSGFCFGVQRAVDIAIEKTDENESIFSYGQLIHNDQVSQKLSEKGLVEINDLNSITNESVIIRSHGVGKQVYEIASKQKLEVVDCTCPFVKKVHKIVDEHYNNGYTIIVVGDENHPEVQGINGWCENQAIIIKDAEHLPDLSDIKYCVVAQTTLRVEKWLAVIAALKNYKLNIEVYNTICSATSERQKSARELARTVDCMIVIGGYHSSNTKKLFEICSDLCENTLHIEKKSDLRVTKLLNCGIIGITAGASTPNWIIKEVYDYLISLD